MNTLEKKLKINKNTCIHCQTLELAKQVLSIFHQLGLKWCTGKSFNEFDFWDNYKEDTVYHPFDGEFFRIELANLTCYKIISAEEFIALHTEAEEFDLENYIPKGELKGFPKEIIARMLEYQEEQDNPRDVSVFEKRICAGIKDKGFEWKKTKEGYCFWNDIIKKNDFNLFFEKYPKQDNYDNSQEFRVGDKVYDILLQEVGVVQDTPNIPYGLLVEFKSGVKSYTINGCYISEYKYPHLLHYRDDYDYSIIDFNNLPKRQEPNRWRAKKGETYYSFTFDFKVVDFCDTKRSLDNKAYNSGNYFQTKEEAQEVADKINKYFQELIKRKGETYYCFTSNFEVEDFYDDDDIFDNKAYNSGNYFKTKEEAQEVADKLNTYFKQLIQEEHENEINQI